MSCIYPKWAWQLKTPNEKGNHELTFQKQDREPDYRIPCAKCAGCQSDKRREWGIRMYHEAQYHDQNSFVTITYNDEHLPGELQPQDARYFVKALKKEIPDMKYFITGEYGEKTRRPHYHAIIFGADFRGASYPIDDQLYGNPLLNTIWPFGTVSIGEFTIASAMYTAGYVAKKTLDRDTFSIMSKRPPIGRAWVDDHKDNLRRIETIQVEGRQWPIPNTYLNWLDADETFNHLRENRKAKTRFATDYHLDALGKNLKSKISTRSNKV